MAVAIPVITAAEWTDDNFAPLDTRSGAETLQDRLNEIADEHPELLPQIDDEVPGLDLPEDPALRERQPTPPAAEPEPQVTAFDDGSSLTVEKKGNIWVGTLAAGHGVQPEVFKGRTKDEMWQAVAQGKINATKKIRQMTRREKLGGTPAPAQAPIEPRVRELTADETFEIKTQLEANPGLAFDTYFQKRTGMTVEQLVTLAKKGQRAEDLLDIEAVCKGFVAEHEDDYFICNDNFFALVGYLYKHKLRKVLGPQDDGDAVILELLRAGHWTVDNLNTAFEDLSESGLLETDPDKEPEPDVAPPAPKPAARTAPPAAPASGRIVHTVKRPRAGLGISPRETTAVISQPDTERPPSDEEARTMPIADLGKLLADAAALRARQALQR